MTGDHDQEPPSDDRRPAPDLLAIYQGPRGRPRRPPAHVIERRLVEARTLSARLWVRGQELRVQAAMAE